MPRAMMRQFEVTKEDASTETIDGWLMLPAGDGNGPFPLLLDVHGGPHAIGYAAGRPEAAEAWRAEVHRPRQSTPRRALPPSASGHP